MPVPVFVGAGSGTTITALNGSVSKTSCTGGNVIILHVFMDGAGTFPTTSATSNISSLGGVASTMDFISGYVVGGASEAAHRLFIGRVTADGTCSTTIGDSTADMFCRMYEFSGCGTGPFLSDVLESTGSQNQGTSTTVSDADPTTLGADRLALQFVSVGSNVTLADFTGETGGDWTEAVAEHSDATGTAGAIQLQTASVPNQGTIGGGSQTIGSSQPWGVIGAALLPFSQPVPKVQPRLIYLRRNR